MMQHKNGRTAAVLLVLMLAACLAALACYLLPGFVHESPQAAKDDTLGMVLIDIPDQDAAAFYHVVRLGVYVLAVDEDSQAYALGVRSGDRLSSVNGVDVATTGDFTRLQEAAGAGAPLKVTFDRGNEERMVVALFAHVTVSE